MVTVCVDVGPALGDEAGVVGTSEFTAVSSASPKVELALEERHDRFNRRLHGGPGPTHQTNRSLIDSMAS